MKLILRMKSLKNNRNRRYLKPDKQIIKTHFNKIMKIQKNKLTINKKPINNNINKSSKNKIINSKQHK